MFSAIPFGFVLQINLMETCLPNRYEGDKNSEVKGHSVFDKACLDKKKRKRDFVFLFFLSLSLKLVVMIIQLKTLMSVCMCGYICTCCVVIL